MQNALRLIFQPRNFVMSNLLPPNATKLEINVEQLGIKITQLEVPFVKIHRIAQCPNNVLAWLAWEYRVEYWNPDWTEVEKRQAIVESVNFNKRRGTRYSIEGLLLSVISDFKVITWHEQTTKRQPFTFIVDIPKNHPVTIDQLLQIYICVDATKSTRDLYSIAAQIHTDNQFYVGGAAVFGMTAYLSSSKGDI